ncbi:protein BLISTER isoform X2 [Nymphaea colorata]|uniref:protein BLISTER isoform X2 n=1 Tax=Nymphaea colorata TaxID=210225 RepID=UPI00129D9E68|nr:protein BLISTER isoform X2 [Nymphaea colorata]
MASAQDASSSSSSARKKQGHLEAGKRRLEEFRKKKAEGRAKRVPSPGHFPLADVANGVTAQLAVENQPSKVPPPVNAIDEVLSSSRNAIPSADGTTVLLPNGRHDLSLPVPESIRTKEHEQASESKAISDSESYGGRGGVDDILLSESHEFKPYVVTEEGSFARIVTERSVFADPGRTDLDHFDYIKNAHLVENDVGCVNNSLEDKGRLDRRHSHSVDMSSNFFPRGLGNALGCAAGYSASKSYDDVHFYSSFPESSDHPRHAINEVSTTNFTGAGVIGHRIFNAGDSHIDHGLKQKSVLPSTISSLKHETTSNYTTSDTITLESNYRSRPSFLDSILVQKVPSSSPASLPELENRDPLRSPKISNNDAVAVQSSSPYPATVKPLVNRDDSYQKKSWDRDVRHLSYDVTDGKTSPKHGGIQRGLESSYALNDDFSALEQHIEDLTQEKFSLQRALDASRTLAESLAAENSSLTDSFNQQGEVVSQLKSDLEKLQEEIRTQSALEEMRIEYTNAQLECSAADERAKLLASEVIGLEEKALRLRSNELKLEKQLESSNAEIASYKKKASNLEKEHRNLQSTIDALQEEKKVLQSKLLKASSNGKSVDTRKASNVTKDASTSTDDLGMLAAGGSETCFPGVVSNAIDHGKLEAESFSLEQNIMSASCSSMPDVAFPLVSTSASIPSDQLQMVENINSLIAELALEKEELVQELASKSSHASHLKDLNKELSQKLEAQTQRLELLIAQNIAHEQPTMRLAESHNVQSVTTYADEGDEVVERVLGWIMKLFPGGSSKRRTSKLL